MPLPDHRGVLAFRFTGADGSRESLAENSGLSKKKVKTPMSMALVLKTTHLHPPSEWRPFDLQNAGASAPAARLPAKITRTRASRAPAHDCGHACKLRRCLPNDGASAEKHPLAQLSRSRAPAKHGKLQSRIRIAEPGHTSLKRKKQATPKVTGSGTWILRRHSANDAIEGQLRAR